MSFPALRLPLTWWHIAEVAAFQHIINASNDRKNTQIFIPRGKAAILAICSLEAGDLKASKHFTALTQGNNLCQLPCSFLLSVLLLFDKFSPSNYFFLKS